MANRTKITISLCEKGKSNQHIYNFDQTEVLLEKQF